MDKKIQDWIGPAIVLAALLGVLALVMYLGLSRDHGDGEDKPFQWWSRHVAKEKSLDKDEEDEDLIAQRMKKTPQRQIFAE